MKPYYEVQTQGTDTVGKILEKIDNVVVDKSVLTPTKEYKDPIDLAQTLTGAGLKDGDSVWLHFVWTIQITEGANEKTVTVKPDFSMGEVIDYITETYI